MARCYDRYTGRSYYCRSAWNDWVRWVVLAVVVIGFFLLFVVCRCVFPCLCNSFNLTPTQLSDRSQTPQGRSPALLRHRLGRSSWPGNRTTLLQQQQLSTTSAAVHPATPTRLLRRQPRILRQRPNPVRSNQRCRAATATGRIPGPRWRRRLRTAPGTAARKGGWHCQVDATHVYSMSSSTGAMVLTEIRN